MNEPCYYRVSVKGLVTDDAGRFLLIREANGMWELPGGGLDHGEEPTEGLKREIYEEMGIKVTSVSPKPAYFFTAERLDYDDFCANIVYAITVENLDFIPSDECEELRFFTVEEAHQVKLFPNIKKLLEVYKK
jgi:8-oxo-dGTP pyrophosphatase MutT (NUDIX family)